MDRRSKIAASLLIALFAGFAMLDASRLPPPRSGGGLGPGFMPLWIGAAVCLLALGQLTSALGTTSGPDTRGAWPQRASLQRVGYMLLALILYVLLSDLIGFFLSTWLFLAAGMRLLADYRWWAVVGGGLVASAAATAVFRLWLTLPLQIGPFGL